METSRGTADSTISFLARRYPLGAAGIIVLGTVTALALAASALPLLPPDAIDTSERLLPIFTPGHTLGTDDLGRDVLSRLVWGARPSLAAAFAATLLAMFVGLAVGLTAGFGRPSVDMTLMRLVDILLAFPPLLLVIAIVAGLGPSLSNAMLAVAIVGVPIYARLARGQVLGIRHLEYVESARAIGASDSRILLRHILPNLIGPVIVVVSLDFGLKIIVVASLSFLGLGIQPPEADWGAMLARGRGFMDTDPQIVILPGLAIAIVVLSLNLVGDALREILDPRFR